MDICHSLFAAQREIQTPSFGRRGGTDSTALQGAIHAASLRLAAAATTSTARRRHVAVARAYAGRTTLCRTPAADTSRAAHIGRYTVACPTYFATRARLFLFPALGKIMACHMADTANRCGAQAASPRPPCTCVFCGGARRLVTRTRVSSSAHILHRVLCASLYEDAAKSLVRKKPRGLDNALAPRLRVIQLKLDTCCSATMAFLFDLSAGGRCPRALTPRLLCRRPPHRDARPPPLRAGRPHGCRRRSRRLWRRRPRWRRHRRRRPRRSQLRPSPNEEGYRMGSISPRRSRCRGAHNSVVVHARMGNGPCGKASKDRHHGNHDVHTNARLHLLCSGPMMWHSSVCRRS